MYSCPTCGTAVEEANRFCAACGDELPAGGSSRLGVYDLVGVIGRGATGVVYLATDSRSGGQVAVKVLDPVLATLPGYPERLRAECDVLVRLPDPHLVTVYGADQDQGRLFLVSEYVRGASLRVVEQRSGRLTPEQALGLIAGALAGLGVAHGHGLIHGDVKPENIVVDESGNSKLIDFGQVVVAGGSALGGTPSYMSPEAARGQPLEQCSDLYSMGVVLYEALAGRTPFTATNDLALLRMQAETPPPLLSEVAEPVADLLYRALAKDPADRPQTSAIFLDQLEAAATASYGHDWRKRAGIAGLAATTTLLVDEVATASPAAAAPTTTNAVHSATGASQVAKGGLLASHPLLATAGAAIAVTGLAFGGVVAAKGGLGAKSAASTATSAPAVSGAQPTFAKVERAVCAKIGTSDEAGDHCAMLAMRVSTTAPQWVLVSGLGYYAGPQVHPNEQDARSDLDEAVINLQTNSIIGPTNVGFCHAVGSTASGPDLSAVPSAVLTEWGMNRCIQHVSASPTTTTPTGITPFMGSWHSSLGIITIAANGDFTIAQSTRRASGKSHVSSPGVLEGTVTSSSSALLSRASVRILYEPDPGVLGVSFSGGTDVVGGVYCNASSPPGYC